MTEREATLLAAAAVSCFPNMLKENMKSTAQMWFKMLGDLDHTLAEAALMKVLSTAKFFPTVAEIREAAASLVPTNLPNAEAAWDEFLRAKRLHGYLDAPLSLKSSDTTVTIMTFREPWDFSHPVVGLAIKAMYGSWKAAYEVMQDETLGVDRKHFLDMYSTLTKRSREDALMPPMVKALAASLRQKMEASLAGKSAARLPETSSEGDEKA